MVSSGIYYTKHARQRMAERNVTELDVQEILRNHHTTYTDPAGNRNYIGHVNGRKIRVVIVGDSAIGVRSIQTVIAD